ncbi:MAG: helix-turn-helix transcriptional regulator [Clostridia bacterium]|nr:helix-turn-helix transcriptional regulator [Clostridia bacterium]
MKEKVYLMHPLEDAAAVSKIYTIYYLEYTKDYRGPDDRHDFWELNYADKGTFYVQCGEKELRVDEGCLLLLPPNLFHRLRADGEAPSNAFIVSFEAQSAALEMLGCTVLKATPVIRELLKAVGQESERAFRLPLERPSPTVREIRLEDRDDAPLGSQQLVRLRLEELLIHILRETADAQGAPRIFTSKAKFDDAIASRVMNILEREKRGPLALEDLTKELGYGKTYLSGMFKRVYGVSIMEKHAQLRLQEAKYLLREGKLSVSEIAYRLGFGTPQYFSRFFSQREGMAPAKYIRSLKESFAVKVK